MGMMDKLMNEDTGGDAVQHQATGKPAAGTVTVGQQTEHEDKALQAAEKQLKIAGKTLAGDDEALEAARYCVAVVANEIATPFDDRKTGGQRLGNAALQGRITGVIAEHLGCSRTVAGKLLSQLVDLGILHRHNVAGRGAFGLWESEETRQVTAAASAAESLLDRLSNKGNK